MSVPIKRLQELARRVPVNERKTAERFLEFLIERSDDKLSPLEAAEADKAKREMKQGKWLSHDEVRKLAGI